MPLRFNGKTAITSAAKESRSFNGREYLLEEAITGDYSIIRAHKADKLGNLTFREAARNFNPTMAKASRITIAEVDEIVETGQLNPEKVVVPGLYVHRLLRDSSFKYSHLLKLLMAREIEHGAKKPALT